MASLTRIDTTHFNDQPQSMLCRVPKDVLLGNILGRLPILEIGNLKLSCKSFYVLTDHPLLFKHLLMRDFQKIEEESKCKSVYQKLCRAEKIHQNILNWNYHVTELKELAGVNHFKIEGDWLIAGNQSTLEIWNLNSKQRIKSLTGHKGAISSLEVQDGKVYTGSSDGTCRIWDLETEECLHTLQHAKEIRQIKIIEEKLITCSFDLTCKIWDPSTGNCLHTLGENEEYFAYFEATKDKVIGFSGTLGLSVWSIDSGACLNRREEAEWISSIKRLNNAVITASGVVGYDCQVLDLETLKPKEDFPSKLLSMACVEIVEDLVLFGGREQWKSWNHKTGEIVVSEKVSGQIIKMIRVDQDKVFTGSCWTNEAKIWDLKTGKCLQTIKMLDSDHFSGIRSLEVKEGKLIISNATSCFIWDFS